MNNPNSRPANIGSRRLARIDQALKPRRLRWAIFVLAIEMFCCGQLSLQMAQAQEQTPTQELGTKATLKDLQGKPSGSSGISQPNSAADSESGKLPIQTLDAAVPDKQFLKHSLKTGLMQLQSGSAQLHFFRAIRTYERIPLEQKKAWENFLMDEASEKASPDLIKSVIDPLDPVLQELDRFSSCEDLRSDLRLRDLPFDQRITVNLLEVQEARALARILKYRAQRSLREQDFGSAMESIRIGIRLAQFVEQGETLVEQLVAMAIRGIMFNCILEAIQTEGCPNLYHHLVMVELSIEPLARSFDFEGISFRDFPVFKEAEIAGWDEATWNQKWSEVFESLAGTGQLGSPDNSTAAKAIGMTFIVGQAKQSKQNLIKAGYLPEKLEAMLPQQIVAIDTARELEKVCNFMQAAVHLPYQGGQLAFSEIEMTIKPSSRPQNVFELLTQLTFPATQQVFYAHHRLIAKKNLLMTVESIREFAAVQGRLPADLSELDRPTIILDPFTNQSLSYQLEIIEGKKVATISYSSKTEPFESRAIRFKIRK